MFEKEMETYNKNKEQLLKTAPNKFVLIKDEQIVAIFETKTDAISMGYKQFGNVPFLVKQIIDIEMPINFYSFKIS